MNNIWKFKIFLAAILILLICPTSVWAQESSSILQDYNQDGIVSYLGFGDSITFGVGDTDPVGGGYVKRLGILLGIPVDNSGVPGEELLTAGVIRFPGVVQSGSDDITGILEGTNDAVRRADTRDVKIALQKLINVSHALGRTVVIMTYPTPCDEHASLAPYTTSYSEAVVNLANVNDVRLADLERAWLTTCINPTECELYNLPEGLHPNALGYDVVAQTIAASILGIDIFAQDGAQLLEDALGLPSGTVVVKPSVLTKVF